MEILRSIFWYLQFFCFGLIHTSDGDFTIEPELFTSGQYGGTRIPHVFAQISASSPSGGGTKDQLKPADSIQDSPPPKVTCDVEDSAPPSNRKRKRKKSKKNHFKGKWENSSSDGDEGEGWKNNYRERTTSGRKRGKRSTSNELHLELMLVTDKKMQELYGRTLERYILTLMSTVAYVYRHPSIGNDISIALVKHWRLTDEESHNIIESTASKTLTNFCKWQSNVNKFDDNDPNHFDVAILLTREDLCRSVASCDVLGLAQKGLVCDHSHNCAIVEDSGLNAAFTIIHELGHILSMPHDHDTDKAGDCTPHLMRPGSNLHVMSRMLDSNSNSWSWSACSRHHFTNLLDSGMGFCLMDKPIEDMLSMAGDERFPGQIYDLDSQCYLQFGPNFRACRKDNTTCERLWCSQETEHFTTCKTQHTPWADGSNCTTNHLIPMWCQRGKCVPIDKNPKSQDGSWGEWKSVGECSRSCGGGIKKSVRECDNPKPSNSGRYCLGVRTRYFSCHVEDCPPSTPDFRTLQCAEFNRAENANALGQGWIPETRSLSHSEICKLYCRLGSELRRLREKVIDGTPCGFDTGAYSVCVNGNCMETGCDRILGSTKKFDVCGVCGGNNSTCKVISGNFNEVHYGYNNAVIIPAGATYIDIKQFGYHNRKDDNYLVLKDRNGVNILNGNHNVTMTKKLFYYGDVVVQYTGAAVVVEHINITKPIQKELIVQVLIVGKLEPPDVRYQYTISAQDENEFDWEYEANWQPCNRVCGGEQFRDPRCFRIVDKLIVDEAHCLKEKKLPRQAQACNLQCELRWHPHQISQCSSLCGPGTRKRMIICAQILRWFHQAIPLPDDVCLRQLGPKPSEVEECEGTCPRSKWEYGEWSTCSKSCGGGEQYRSAHCVNNQGHKHEDSHCDQSQMVNSQPCNVGECPRWEMYSWNECSVSCGTGERQRSYSCQHGGLKVADHFCNATPLPEHKEPCVELSGCKWQHGPWSECTRPCGGGVMRRQVVCSSERHPEERHSDDMCGTKPAEELPCNEHACSTWHIGPWEKCSKDCGAGIQIRVVKCSDHQGQTVPDFQCDVNHKPTTSQKCQGHDCYRFSTAVPTIPTSVYRWHTGTWSQCCNGYARRQVICIDQNEISVPIGLCEGEPPKKRRPCKATISDARLCPRWVGLDEWSRCAGSCENSTQTQSVVCRVGHSTVDSDSCDLPKPKAVVRPCLQKHCSYRWAKKKWNKCSPTCGSGNRYRDVFCQMADGSKADDKYCRGIKKPKTEKKCRSQTCPFNWIMGHWSDCSRPCGPGIQRRTISCHRGNVYGWVDSVSVPQPSMNPSFSEWCNITDKPSEVRSCNMGSCARSINLWKTGPWTQCNVECGRGRQSRRVKCLDRMGRKLNKDQCDIRLKPKNKRRCVMRTCNPMSCKDIKKLRNVKTDGEYMLNVKGKNIRVFCKDMHKTHPREYITLNSESDNYSVMYRKMNSVTCRSPRFHRPLDTCGCPDQYLIEQSRNTFKRIAINITSLRVFPYDYTYSHYSGDSGIPYGQSNCSYQYRCPQSKFRLDLRGTGLKVASETKWPGQGNFQKYLNGQVVQGKCGGLCGNCIPSPEVGLRLDVTPP